MQLRDFTVEWTFVILNCCSHYDKLVSLVILNTSRWNGTRGYKKSSSRTGHRNWSLVGTLFSCSHSCTISLLLINNIASKKKKFSSSCVIVVYSKSGNCSLFTTWVTVVTRLTFSWLNLTRSLSQLNEDSRRRCSDLKSDPERRKVCCWAGMHIPCYNT